MSLLAQDPNSRYKVAPRKSPRTSKDDDQPPTAKVPEKVAVPVPVPTPVPVPVASSRYKITMPQVDLMNGQPQTQPSQIEQARSRMFDLSKMQPFPATSPVGDTARAPVTPAAPVPATAQTDEDIPPALAGLRQAQSRLSTDEAAPVKKDKWYKSALKMLAYGAKDMPPAHNWAEFAYGAGRSLGSGAAGAIKHDLPGQIQKRYQIARDEADVERAQKSASVESQIQGRSDLSKYRVARLGQFKDTADEKKAFDQWRMKQGNQRLGDYEAWTKWRETNGDRTAKHRDDYFEWQKQAESDRLSQRKTEFDWRKESKVIDQRIARERTAAMAQNRADRFAGDRREADVLDSAATDYENQGDDEEEPEIRDQKYNAAQRLRTRANSIRAKIPQQSTPTAPSSSAPTIKAKPKSDPLGLFKQ